MKKRAILFALLIVLTAGVAFAQQCVTPTDGQQFSTDTLLCAGVYAVPAGISVAANTVLDCDGASVQGAGANTGITVVGDNVQVRNCRIVGFAVGLAAQNVQGFVETGLTFAANGQDRSISLGEELPLQTGKTTDEPAAAPTTTADQPAGAAARKENSVPSEGTTLPTQSVQTGESPATTQAGTQEQPTIRPVVTKPDASIWEVADIKSEKLLENALSFEYESGAVPQDVLAQRVALLQETFGDVRFTRQFVYSNGRTTMRLQVIPDAGFFRRVYYDNITLYEYIPKCFAQLVDEVVFEGAQPTILSRDPLLKKVIPTGEPLRFSYSTMRAISQECRALFRVVGLGAGRKVDTFSSVLAERGFVEVLKEFPVESTTVIAFIALLGTGAFLFKRKMHNIR